MKTKKEASSNVFTDINSSLKTSGNEHLNGVWLSPNLSLKICVVEIKKV